MTFSIHRSTTLALREGLIKNISVKTNTTRFITSPPSNPFPFQNQNQRGLRQSELNPPEPLWVLNRRSLKDGILDTRTFVHGSNPYLESNRQVLTS